MDLKHKHWALIAIALLVAAFVVLVIWHTLGSETVVAPAPQEATSTTPQPASSTPPETLHITEHGTYYDIDLTYPSATPLKALSTETDAQAVATMRATMQDLAAQFKQNGNFANLSYDDVQTMGLDQRKEALSSTYKTYTGAHTVSYVFEVYEDTLGAHPNAYYRTFTFDTKTGQQIELPDLFLPSVQYLTVLSTRARADLPGIMQRMSGVPADTSYIQEGTMPTKNNFQTFYIEGKNLTLIFPPYQVGPYALGTITDPIPLARLAASLRPEYTQ